MLEMCHTLSSKSTFRCFWAFDLFPLGACFFLQQAYDTGKKLTHKAMSKIGIIFRTSVLERLQLHPFVPTRSTHLLILGRPSGGQPFWGMFSSLHQLQKPE